MIELTHASFQYENSDRGVRDISLSVKGGECSNSCLYLSILKNEWKCRNYLLLHFHHYHTILFQV